ncbi:MAG: TonB C-terminal domain-containing protein [Limisphaerales bacterium]|nr:MAG: TonB C-terminal domain-containing protein [Limisphaerales bacterium]
MGKLKRSCLAGSFVLHAMIIALLVLGPMLLAKRQEKIQVIDLIPSEIVDQILSPKVSVTPPTTTKTKPTPPKPKPVKITKPKPTPPKPKPVKITKPKPQIKVNLKPTIRRPDSSKVKAQQEAAERARKAYAKRQETLNNSINRLSSNLSRSTAVNAPLGRLAAANYESLIRKKYMDATFHPGAINRDPVVKVRLVIARSGNVLSAQIINNSGVTSWNRAVQKSLDRVKHIAPFPKSISGSKKTFTLNFNSRSFK